MTSINNLPNYSGYYQLSRQTGGNVNQSGGTGGVLSALGGSGQSGLSSDSSAYLLDLSPQARQYLAGLNSSQPSGNTYDSKSSFILTKEQQQKITEIIDKYKDAPFTQDTFNQIQNDLDAAGMSPDKLAAKENAKNYNPTMVLIDALNGSNASENGDSGVMNDQQKQTKTDNFMQQIVSQWKDVSKQSSASSSDVSADAVSAVGSTGGA